MELIKLDAKNLNIDNVKNIIDEHGYIILENILDKNNLECLREDLETHFQRRFDSKALFFGFNTKRIEALFAKSKIVQEMAINSTVIDIVEHILKPHCDTIQINLTQGIRINPGEKQQILHPDSALYPIEPKPFEFIVNALWAYSDFTEENGATRIVPKSHKWDALRQPEKHEILSAKMSAGSVLIYQASLLHGGGANISSECRTGIAIGYCLGWLRQSENQYLTYPRKIVKNFDQKLQDLLGYEVHKPNLGWVHGHSPKNVIYPKDYSNEGAEDFLTDSQKELLKEYYDNEDLSLTSHNYSVS